MKKQRLVLYVEPQTIVVIEQLAAMEDSSVSAFSAAYLDRIVKRNDENRALRGLMPELKNDIRRAINSASAQQRRIVARAAVECTVARALTVHLLGLSIGEKGAFELSEQAFEIAERSIRRPLEGFEKLIEVLDWSEADSVGDPGSDPGEDEPNRPGSSNSTRTGKDKF